MTERLWVQIPTDAGHFSLLYPISSATLIQVPHGGATLLIFLSKICLSAQLEAKRAQYPWIEKKLSFLPLQFLSHLTLMFDKSRTKGHVQITMKRCNYAYLLPWTSNSPLELFEGLGGQSSSNVRFLFWWNMLFKLMVMYWGLLGKHLSLGKFFNQEYLTPWCEPKPTL